MSSKRLDVTRSNEEPVRSGEEILSSASENDRSSSSSSLFVARHGCGRPGGGLGLGGGGIFLCMSLPHALFLGTPGELSQEKGTCVRSGDDSRRHRGWRDDASTETHERRGVGSGESSSGAGVCPSALRSSLSVPARLVMMIWRSMENDATRRDARQDCSYCRPRPCLAGILPAWGPGRVRLRVHAKTAAKPLR
nr:unnamed protein product [Digitaria exilis]